MYKQKHGIFFLVFLVLCVKSALGQITASPSFTGCAPYSVILSGPVGATNIYWTFGPSMGSATLSSPNPIYSNPGNYIITYTALVSNTPVSYTAQIVVKSKPIPNFSANIPTSHCLPLVVTLNGSGGSAGSTYIWAFGDLGAVGSGATVTHTYVTANSFVPILTVIDAVSGCTASANSNVTVNVSALPTLSINSLNGLSACIPPFTTTINANGSVSGSPLGGGLNYSWSFNVGSPSNAAGVNAGAITFGIGIHTITLNATDNNQCSTTHTQVVSVVNPSLTATFPATICFNSPVPGTITTNQSNATVSIVGSTGSTVFPTPTATTAIDTVFILDAPAYSLGSHTVVVTVQPVGCSPLTYTQAIYIESITVNFTWPNPTITCQPTLLATYVNQTTLNTSAQLTFTWNADNEPLNYNHGVPSSSVITGLGTPTFTFSQGHPNPYVIYQPFQPMITVIAQSNSMAHCKAKLLLPGYTIIRPTAYFIVDTTQGCAPVAVTFTDISTTFTSFPITSYTWCNGASPPTYSTGTISSPPALGNGIPNFSFTYSVPGVYHPYLQIQTAAGCPDISFQETITVNVPPVVSATYPGSVCAGQPFTINMSNTPATTIIDHWHATTDNSFFSGCVTNASPTFFMTHLGIQQVTVTGYAAGCAGTVALSPTILVKGPIGKFRMETDCSGNKRSVKFTIHLQESISSLLDFGDGHDTTVTGNPLGSVSILAAHTYSVSNDYTVTLTSTGNNGCSPYVFKQIAKIRSAKANITYNGNPIPALPKAMACVRDAYKFSGTGSSDHFVSCEYAYTWFFQTPTYTLSPLTQAFVPPPFGVPRDHFQSFNLPDTTAWADPIAMDTFRYAGTYTIALLVKDINGCVDVDTRPFRISSAVPVFTFASNPVCLSAGEIQLINTTQSAQVPPDTIKHYVWNFGDNTPDTVGTNPYFIPKHKYYNTPPPSYIFSVICIAVNNVGCIDTTIHKLQVNNPIPYFQASTAYPCVPLNSAGVVSYSAGAGYTTYSVNYGESPPQPWISGPNFNNASHAYAIPGTYISTLSIIDNAGCKASESITTTAIGQPTAFVSFPDNKIGDCSPWQLLLTSTSSINVTPITNYIWSIGNISSPPPGSYTLQNTYLAPVTTVSLTVSMTSLGLCPSTKSVQVYTYDPVASGNISPTLICLGENISASIYIDHDVAQWQWFFGDFVQQPIRYNTMFTPTTVSYPYTTFPTSGGVDGNTKVTLSYNATNDPLNTCRKFQEIPIRIIEVNSDFKNVTDVYSHCLKISDTFTNVATNFPDLHLNYNWDFGDQSTGSSTSAGYSHTYALAGTFPVSLTVRDADYGCKALSVKQMTIFPLPSATLSSKTDVCMDAPFVITGSAAPGVSGAVTATMIPAISNALVLDTANVFTTTISLSESTVVSVNVTDNNNCKSTSNLVNIVVLKPTQPVHWDTTVVIGQPVPLNAFVGSGFTYTWTPLTAYLNCDTCRMYNPVSSSTINITYSVAVEDNLQCSVVKSTYHINIDVVVSLDVPTAFTPNGDGINDMIFPAGWGLRKLNYFKIFNRWGQLIFESNDLSIGWDGVYQGVPQNMETYVYQVSAETLSDKEPRLSKTGTFKLLR